MCSVREHFDTYQPCEIDTINTANGTQSRIARVGTVWIRMFDGVVRIVTGLRLWMGEPTGINPNVEL